MAVLLAFAFVSGIVTILSPCILPILPIVLSGGVGGGRARPLGVVAGFAASFTAFTLTLSAIVRALHFPADALRAVAVAFIVLFGLVMLVPQLQQRFELAASRIAGWGGRAAGRPGEPRRGFWGGVPVGLSLGLVWTPCVGPIMASVISLALTTRIDAAAVLITLAYTVGTSLPMLAIMFGGRALLARVPALSRNAGSIQKGFGVVMIAVGVAIGLGWDRRFQAAVLDALPGYGAGLTAIEQNPAVAGALAARDDSGGGRTARADAGAPGGEGVFHGTSALEPPVRGALGDYGRAPELVAGGAWFNTGPATGTGAAPPLSMEALRGKVVLVDFWTYSCVNCVRTIPYLRQWYRAYGDRGLVIIGVHTPEFEFEKKAANVERAIRDLGVEWPVVQDNDYAQWNAYGNRFWPAHYFVDASGRVRYFHFGEGEYDVSERIIRELLAEAGAQAPASISEPAPEAAAGGAARTPETYLGYARGRGFASAVAPLTDAPADYRPARVPGNGEWSLDGRWTIASQYVVPASAGGTLALGFDARKVFLVVEPEASGGTIRVLVDGKPAPDTPDVRGGVAAPAESRLYQIVGLDERGPHVLTLVVEGKLRLFAFTFG